MRFLNPVISSSSKRKILYVCPLAHRGGHRPSAILTETMALTSAGFEVALLTFNGFPHEGKHLQLEQLSVLSHDRISTLLLWLVTTLNCWTLTRNISILVEQFSTLLRAVLLRKKMRYDVIHLTDGDPFAFLVLFLSFFLKDYIWVIHLIFDPGNALGKIDYSSLWLPIYRRSLNRNCFVFLCENEKIKKAYEGVINGLFNRKTIYFPLSTRYVGNTYTKEEARLRLKLPVGKILFLCFGSQHSGKDLMVVASACRDLANVEIVIAGKGSADTIYHLKLANNTIIIRDYYVPEHEKPLYYAAADAVIISYHKSFLERRSGALLWDACKFGAMVIASDGGQIGELVKSFQVGLVFETENPVSLRNAIVHFFNLRQEDINIYKENCKEFCASFSMESWSENYKVMLDNLFTNRHT